MATRPADWYEQADTMRDYTAILGVLTYQAGGRIEIPYEELVTLHNEVREALLSIRISEDGGWIVQIREQEEDEIILPDTTYLTDRHGDYFASENEEPDKA